MSSQASNNSKDKMDKASEHCRASLKGTHRSRASFDVDNIRVNYYGTPTPLNQVAALSTPDARSFLISPWETSI